jgi:hypothetical protein
LSSAKKTIHPLAQRLGVHRCPHLPVIVEVDEYVAPALEAIAIDALRVRGLATLRPRRDPNRPAIQCLVVIAAGIQFLRPMEAAVDEA